MKITVLIDGQAYEVDIQDINKRPIVAIVDGEQFEIHPETEIGTPAALEPAAGKDALAESTEPNNTTLLAPLPGTVTEIFVLPGAQVEAGQPVCVIEAMKMKNTIRSYRGGSIASVHITPGQSVKHKQVLVEFAE